MKQSSIFITLLLALFLLSPASMLFAQKSQLKCQPKRSFWKNKEVKDHSFLTFKKKQKERAEKAPTPQKIEVVKEKKQARVKTSKYSRKTYAKRVKAIKKEGKLVASNLRCPR